MINLIVKYKECEDENIEWSTYGLSIDKPLFVGTSSHTGFILIDAIEQHAEDYDKMFPEGWKFIYAINSDVIVKRREER